MGIDDIKQKIEQSLRESPSREKIAKISLFGSYVRGEQRNTSDIDLLIEFQQPVGYFELVRIQDSFEKKLNKRVDLVTPESLSHLFRNEVLEEAQPLYEK